jgi:hypothetical protein
MDTERDKTGVIFIAVFIPIVILIIVLRLLCRSRPPPPPLLWSPRHRRSRQEIGPYGGEPIMGYGVSHPVAHTPAPVFSPPAVSRSTTVRSPRSPLTVVHSPVPAPQDTPPTTAHPQRSTPVPAREVSPPPPPRKTVRFAESPPQTIPRTDYSSSSESESSQEFPPTPIPGSPNPADIALPDSPPP